MSENKKKSFNLGKLFKVLNKIDPKFERDVKLDVIDLRDLKSKGEMEGIIIERGASYPGFVMDNTVYTRPVKKKEDFKKEYLDYSEHKQFPHSKFPSFYFDFNTNKMYEVEKELKDYDNEKSVKIKKTLYQFERGEKNMAKKKTTKKKKRTPISLSDAKALFEARSKHAQEVDEGMSARISPYWETYGKDPSRFDVAGVDAVGQKKDASGHFLTKKKKSSKKKK